jgi:hypothetical protein
LCACLRDKSLSAPNHSGGGPTPRGVGNLYTFTRRNRDATISTISLPPSIVRVNTLPGISSGKG